jgi:hypothetical protein
MRPGGPSVALSGPVGPVGRAGRYTGSAAASSPLGSGCRSSQALSGPVIEPVAKPVAERRTVGTGLASTTILDIIMP